MSSELLRTLSIEGLRGVPASRFEDLADWCTEYCESTGDARYCIIGASLSPVFEWWTEHDRGGGVPTVLAERINQALLRELPTILETSSPAEAASRAGLLRRELLSCITSPSDWEDRGYVHRRSP